MSEKLARNDTDNLRETRTARNRSVFRLQMQLWPCDSTRSGTIGANRSPKRRFRVRRTLSLCTVCLLTCLCAAQDGNPVEAAKAKSLALVGKPAPDFALPDLNQHTVTLAERRGHIVILAFWATWCPPCRSEMPLLARLQSELASRSISVVPVAFDSAAKARAFLAKNPAGIWSAVDESGQVAALYGAHALPKTFVINRDGVVTNVILGKLQEAEVRSAIRMLEPEQPHLLVPHRDDEALSPGDSVAASAKRNVLHGLGMEAR